MEDKFTNLSLHEKNSRSSMQTNEQTGADNGSAVKRTASTSSQYNNINADLHARVKAFQEQRALKRSASVGSNKSEQDKGNSQSPKHIQQIVNKPLPPLPVGGSAKVSQRMSGQVVQTSSKSTLKNDLIAQDTQDTIVMSKATNVNININKTEVTATTIGVNTGMPAIGVTPTASSTASAAHKTQLLNPNRRAPRRPPSTQHPARPSIAQHKVPAIINTPKQSLSARRGLKLPPGGMSLKMPIKTAQQPQQFAPSPSNKKHIETVSNSVTVEGKRSNPGSLINGVQSTSTSSSTEGQRDTVGTKPRSSNSNNSSSSGSSGGGGLFANFSKYVDIKSGSLNFAGKLSLSSKGIDFSNGSSSRITLDELEFLDELGHGNYGNVSKVLHKPTNVIMATKEVRLELDEAKFRQILMELEVLHKCNSPFIVDFYGAFFIEGAVYMCMEYMDGGSLDKIYDESSEIGGIDEPQLAFIANAVIHGLRELKEQHNIIHRDVKPTNILCSANQGTVKLCDFGVSGNLVASLAKTNIGCQSYMAPERIKSLNPDRATYTVQSDIWSLGLSILEMALGRYPYPPETFDNIFSQLSAIVDGPPPRLPSDKFSSDAQDFVSLCLQKIPERRPTYSALAEHPWLVKYRNQNVQMSTYITERLERRSKILQERGENGLSKNVPALHMGGL
ncbi:Pbs2p [Saccharomyces cerevisiae x Saccharomyces kudriavzevii VIN7]|uniref:mitogen-activated protein kinase kinase n=1 Tax=Saccharomyces cerevisiae x Saccharomyces kudriavzevii (strain VIN7) TaxID=1095631 RepID=H0GWP3_SACCK|nr:Pbs2p [Saccharomyces cerevisiae x Saccharomyces kudriavzevii VIN7]